MATTPGARHEEYTWIQAHPAMTPGYWVALFGSEVLVVAETLREVLAVLARTPLPGTALVYQAPGRTKETCGG